MSKQFHVPYSLLPEDPSQSSLGSSLLRWLGGFFSTLDVSTRATVPTPVNSTDAATKSYVDGLFVPAIATIEEADGAPSITNPSTLRFDQADGFVVTNPSTGIARVDLSGVPGSVLASGVTFPSGTVMLFRQAAAPTGWTRLVAAGVTESTLIVRTNGEALTDAGSWTVSGLSSGSTSAGTPAGTVSAPMFTGDALGTHTHTFTGSALGTHTHTFTGDALATHQHQTDMISAGSGTLKIGTNYGSGTSIASIDQVTMTATGSTGSSELTQAVSGGTPTGTNSSASAGTPAGTNSSTSAGTPSGTISTPTFTGSALSGHTHTVSQDGSWRPLHVSVILATKD